MNPVTDSYRRYKSGTTKLVNYLVNTAKCHDELVTGNLTQNHADGEQHRPGKTAKNTDIKVSTRDLVRFAALIHASPDTALKVPSAIIQVTQEVIALRTECACWYRADEGHAHFIEILKDILQLLRPRVSSSVSGSRSINMPTPKPTERAANMYNELQEEDDEEDFSPMALASPSRTSSPSWKARSSSHGKPTVRYSLEELEGEISLAYFCFLKDLQSIREYIHGKWRDYVAGEISLTTVSITTNAAFGLIRDVEHKLMQQFARFTDYESFQGFAEGHPHADTTSETTAESVDPEESMGNITNEEEFLWGDTYSMLQRFKTQMQGEEKMYIPLYANIDLCEQGVDKNAPLDALLTEVSLFYFHYFPTMFGDELLSGIFFLADNEPVTPSKTACAQILVDIHSILGTSRRKPFEDLRRAAGDVVCKFDQHSNMQHGSHQAYQAETALSSVVTFINEWVRADGMANLRKHTTTRFPDRPPYQLFNAHPVLCGLLANFITSQLHECSLSICSTEGAVIAAAHIYNAATKSGLLKSKWPDMDQVIEFQGADQIFIGEAPSKADEMCSRAYLASGFPAHWFSKDSQTRPKHLTSSLFKPSRELKVSSPYIKAVNTLQVQGRITAYQSGLMNFAELIAQNCFEAMQKDLPTGTQKKPTTYRHKEKKLDQLQLLEALHSSLVAEERHIQYDYLRMHHMCVLILEDLRRSLSDRIKDYLNVDDNLIGTKPIALAPLILEAASRESRTMLFRSTIIAKVAGHLTSILACATGCGEDESCCYRRFHCSLAHGDIDPEGRIVIGKESIITKTSRSRVQVSRRTKNNYKESLLETPLATFYNAICLCDNVGSREGKNGCDAWVEYVKQVLEGNEETLLPGETLRTSTPPRGKNAAKNKKSSEKRKAKKREKAQLREPRELPGEYTSRGGAGGANETSEEGERGTESAEEDSEYTAAALE